MKLQNKILMVAALSFLALACETPEDNTIEKARKCVDNASKVAISDAASAATQAQACDTMLGATTGKEANKVRFGIILLIQQKMAQMANIVNASKTSAGGRDPFANMSSAVVFTGASASSDATRIYDSAVASGSTSLIFVGSFIFATTYASVFSSTAITDAASAAAAFAAVPAAQQATLGAAILNMQSSACASPTDNNSTDPNNPCYKMKQALNGASDPTAAFAAFQTYLQTPH